MSRIPVYLNYTEKEWNDIDKAFKRKFNKCYSLTHNVKLMLLKKYTPLVQSAIVNDLPSKKMLIDKRIEVELSDDVIAMIRAESNEKGIAVSTLVSRIIIREILPYPKSIIDQLLQD